MVQGGLVFDRVSEHEIDVRDTISDQQYRISSSEPIETQQTAFDSFPGPTTDALALDAVDLRISGSYGVTFRDEAGNFKEATSIDGSTYTGTNATHFIELSTPVKSYLRIDGPFRYEQDTDGISIDLSESRWTVLGARPWPCYSEEIITVSESLDDLREAISCFGGSIQTTSPERSFPTLRGHPPVLRIGDTLEIPDSVSKPDAGITVTVPPTRVALLTVAPLAYYLLATVEFGENFQVETADGFVYRPTEETLPEAVQSVLTRCFYLDCLVRTEGLYPVDLRARDEFESVFDGELAYETLYEQSLSKRTETYLKVDVDVVETVMPDWPVTAFVEPDLDSVEALPYLVYELAHIQPANPPRYTGEAARKHILDTVSGVTAEKTRSTALVFEEEEAFVELPETTGQQTLWVGDGIPLNGTTFLPEGYQNTVVLVDEHDSTAKTETASAGMEITLVCNDSTMDRESVNVEDYFEMDETFSTEVSAHFQVTKGELRRIIEAGTGYLHFVGHATPDGLECVDGLLNVATVRESNVKTFFLNACQSFQQGKHLVERGSTGGIVTYSDVSDRHALETGGLIVQLLNSGFPIGACLSVVRESTPIGNQYVLVGNHASKVRQTEGVVPHSIHVKRRDESYELEITAYATGAPRYTIGAIVTYVLDSLDNHFLVPSTVTVALEEEELREFLSLTEMPIIFEGRLQSQAEFFEAIER